MTSKMFPYPFMIAALGFVGLFACVEPPRPDPDPETAVDPASQISDEVSTFLEREGCCIDYFCPTNGFEVTGCKIGLYGPGIAFRQCASACGTYCETSDWYCDR